MLYKLTRIYTEIPIAMYIVNIIYNNVYVIKIIATYVAMYVLKIVKIFILKILKYLLYIVKKYLWNFCNYLCDEAPVFMNINIFAQ